MGWYRHADRSESLSTATYVFENMPPNFRCRAFKKGGVFCEGVYCDEAQNELNYVTDLKEYMKLI